MTSRRNFIKNSVLASTAAATTSVLANTDTQTNVIPQSELPASLAKIGAISWTFGLDDLDELFAKAKEIGYQGLQFCGNHKKYQPQDVLEAAQKYDLELFSYDPFNTQPPEKKLANLENSIDWYMDIMEFALALKVPMLTLQGLSNWTVNQPDYQKSMEQIIQAVAALDKEAQKHHLTLTYEACNQYEIPWVQTADELLRIHQESGAKQLMLVLDSFHMNMNEKNMIDPIRKVGDLLHSYHISDSTRGGIGSGQVDFVQQYKTLQEIGFSGPVFCEIAVPEIRPYKLPMNDSQMGEFESQARQSMRIWQSMAGL